MWKTLHAIRDGAVLRTYESIHKNMPIEQVIEITWQPKEKVPAVAAPRLGGPIAFWKTSLHSLQAILESFGQDLHEEELRWLAHPHPISGPLERRSLAVERRNGSLTEAEVEEKFKRITIFCPSPSLLKAYTSLFCLSRSVYLP